MKLPFFHSTCCVSSCGNYVLGGGVGRVRAKARKDSTWLTLAGLGPFRAPAAAGTGPPASMRTTSMPKKDILLEQPAISSPSMFKIISVDYSLQLLSLELAPCVHNVARTRLVKSGLRKQVARFPAVRGAFVKARKRCWSIGLHKISTLSS